MARAATIGSSRELRWVEQGSVALNLTLPSPQLGRQAPLRLGSTLHSSLDDRSLPISPIISHTGNRENTSI